MKPYLQNAEAERLLESVGASSRGRCQLLVALDPPQVLWTSAAVHALFATDDRTTLTRAVFGRPADARPIVTRLSRLQADEPPRLEGVPVSSRFTRSTVVFSCRVLPQRMPKLLLLETNKINVPEEAGSLGAPDAPLPSFVRAATGSSAPERSASHQSRVALPSGVTTAAQFGVAAASRFTWRTEADGRLVQIGPEMQATFGLAALQVDDKLQDRLRAIGSDAALAMVECLDSHSGWSTLIVEWPGEDANISRPITFGGTLSPGSSGFRGFGLIGQVIASHKPAETAETTVEEAKADADGLPADAFAQVPEMADEPQAADPIVAVSAAAAEPVIVDEAPEAPEARVDEITQRAEPETIPPIVVSSAASAADDGPRVDLRPVVALLARPKAEDSSPNVVHMSSFKAGAPAAFGKAVARREPQDAIKTEGAPEPLDPPQWSEAPKATAAAGNADQRLSSHERFNFDEIARALASLPGADAASRTAAQRPDVSSVPPSSVPAMPTVQLPLLPGEERLLFEGLPLGILVVQAACLAYANHAALALAGYDTSGDLERDGGLARIFGRPDIASTDRADTLHPRHGRPIPVDARRQDVVWHGVVATLWSIQRVGTARPVGDGPLEPSADDLTEALDLAASGVGFLDRDGRILSLNGGAERLFGFGQADLVGKPCNELFTEGEGRDFLARFLAGAPVRTAAFGKAEGRKRDGTSFTVGVSLRRTGHDRICVVWQHSVHGFATASELDLLRRDAERANALKSEFLAKISHEIRTPLNAMLGFTEVIIEERFGAIGNDRYREYLNDIHAAGRHVVSLVNDLLDLSRIEAGGLEITLAPVDVNAIVSDCVAALQGQAHRDRVIIRMSLAARGPMAMVDERSLRQIVLNLLSNAVKFNETGGQVIVSTALSDAGRVIVRVRDTGPGMSQAEIETAMKPFRQLATPKAKGGSGLGLPLTQAMVEACNGSLRVESKPGEGTLVEVAFQRVADPAVSLQAE